jgi:NitT/TauT family transport system permease protein
MGAMEILLPLAIFGLGLEILSRHEIISPLLIPAPSRVLSAIFEEGSGFMQAAFETALAASVGLAMSIGAGLSLAALFSLSPRLRRVVFPYTILFQTVPVVAVAPLLVVWLGFGLNTVIASAFIVSVFPVMSGALTGLTGTDPALLDMARGFGASRLQVFWQVRVPFGLPAIFSGIRSAGGLSVVGAIVGEFIAGGGLGGLIDVSRTQQRVDLVFGAIALATVLGLCFLAMTQVLQWFFLSPWHSSYHQAKGQGLR